MTIKELVNACNSHPEIWVDIFTCYTNGYELLYSGHYDRLTDRMLDWEVETFDVKELNETDYGLRRVTRMKIVLEYDTYLH